MLDTDTKHRVDIARDILVGKVPDPANALGVDVDGEYTEFVSRTRKCIYRSLAYVVEYICDLTKYAAGEQARIAHPSLTQSPPSSVTPNPALPPPATARR